MNKLSPYVPGEQPKDRVYIKLNANENPYPPSPKVIDALRSLDTETAMRKYPDPTSGDLVRALEKYHDLDEGQVFVGAGSDDVLSIAFLTFFNSDKPVLFPLLTFESHIQFP